MRDELDLGGLGWKWGESEEGKNIIIFLPSKVTFFKIFFFFDKPRMRKVVKLMICSCDDMIQ